jgi:hypothetical protein
MRGIAWLAAAVVLGLGLAWMAAQPPRPRAPSAPAIVFSAERALAEVRVIAREPHPVGSAANARVRDHLLRRLAALGLEPSMEREQERGVAVENVFGRLRGADPRASALVLMAHYDSVPGSPGAADDAAGVAAIRETMRALRAARFAPHRDVWVLFTDGEEAGLLGARAAFRTRLQAVPVGAVLNFEARGGGGRVHMFETGPDNGALIALYGDAVASPSANSLMRFVYERMPNGTDFTIPKSEGLAGLNFAFMGDYAAYHTPLATPERLDRGSLQHMGDQALALTSALAASPRLPPPSRDVVYSDIFGVAFLSYAKTAGWLILSGAGALLAFAYNRASRTELAETALIGRAAALASGAGRLLLGTVLAAAGLWTAGLLLARPDAMPSAALREASPLILTAFAALIAASVLLAHVRMRRPASAWIGALVVGWGLAAALQAAAPETAFVVAWPVLWGALAAALLPADGRWRAPLAALSGAIGLAWIAGLLHLLFLGVGFLAPVALAAGALLAPLVLHPLLPAQAAARRGAALT